MYSRRVFKKVPFLITMGLFSLLLANCSQVQFNKEAEVLSSSLLSTDGVHYEYKADINVTASARAPLDLVWAIDNSGSMSQEIAHVKSNFAQFIANVQDQTDLRLALISASTGTYGVSLPASGEASRFLQISQTVASNNALQITSSMLCPNGLGLCAPYANPQQQGKLFNFLRADSQKVFIVVSDDESSVSAEQFRNVFAQVYPSQNFTFYGFVGLGAASPCQAARGQVYQSLATQTGGDTFDICDADWRQTFSELVQKVVNLSVPPVVLPHSMSQIVVSNVMLDGRTLMSDEYTLSEKGLMISLALLSGDRTYKVHVSYTLKQEPSTN